MRTSMEDPKTESGTESAAEAAAESSVEAAAEPTAAPVADEREAEGEELSGETLATGNVLGFILVPAFIVMTILGIVYLFYLLTYEDLSVADYQRRLDSAIPAERWQAAIDLVQRNRTSPQLVPVLVEILESEPGEQNIESTAWASGDLLKSPEEKQVNLRWYAAHALGNMDGDQPFGILMKYAADQDAGVRFYAAHGLGRIRNPGAVDALVERLRTDEDDPVRTAAAWALGEIADPRAAEPLLEVWRSNPATDVRWNCALALSRFGVAEVRPTLDEMLKAENPHTRDQARQAIRLLENPPKRP